MQRRSWHVGVPEDPSLYVRRELQRTVTRFTRTCPLCTKMLIGARGITRQNRRKADILVRRIEKRLRNGETLRKEIEEKESRKCFACANGTSQESKPDKMHRPLSVELASEKSASWPDVRSAIAAHCSMGESDVEKMGAVASSIFVCSIHSNDLRRAIAQVMRSPMRPL